MPLTIDQLNIIAREGDLRRKEEERQNAIEKRLSVLADDWDDQLKEAIAPQLSPETREKISAYIDSTQNPAKDIINDISDIYTFAPHRTFDPSGVYEDIYAAAEVDGQMEIVNRLTNGLNEVILYPVWRKSGGVPKIYIDILTPNVVTVIASDEDPTVPEVVLIKKRFDDRIGFTPDNTYYVAWTKEEHYLVDYQGKPSALETNPNMINPFGVLPFIFIHRERPIDSVWNETGGNDLFELTIKNGINATYDWLTRIKNGFKQPAISGNMKDGPPKAIMSTPDVALYIKGEGVNIQMLDYQVDLKALDESRARHIQAVADQFGIKVDSGGQVQEGESGRALIIRNEKFNRNRIKQLKVYEKAEKELFELIKIIRAKGPDGNGGEPDNTGMVIDFKEPEATVDEKTKLEILGMEVEMNVKSMVDAFIARNPDYADDRDGAQKELSRVIEENNKYRNMIDAPLMDALNGTREVI